MKTSGLLNSVSNRREFEGVLIQIDGGFGCIHPWPELGDPPLEKCLADLAGARRWPIVRRAIRCTEFDRAARVFDHSLFEEMEVPDSHATLARNDVADVALAVEAGFQAVKLKFGRDPEGESGFLNDMSAEYPAIRWRLDFNESLTTDAAAEFLLSLHEKSRAAIDFVEDPCPYSESAWAALHRQTRVKLAVDREAAPLSTEAQVMVVKPAIDEPFLLGEAAMRNSQRVVVTSYMDHPLGQAFAAWEAARLGLQLPGLVGMCGLQTHHLFAPDAFTEMLGPWSPAFQPPAGNGLGFDDLLDTLSWTRLY
ncbi:MAG: enolase C-terminal domain-like protein [Luteolibacter sp.]|nr:enolase C-terminal domain-like protein [Luteolibacter sp.]